MKIFTPGKLLCKIGLHDWLYGYNFDNKKYYKKCSRCDTEKEVNIKEAEKKFQRS